VARKQRGKGLPQKPGASAPQRPQAGGGWAPLRDAIRRDVEQAVSALAFAERLYHKLDMQRRLFHDFPRVMEQLRSGALERVATALSRLYEGGQGFDLQRFLRDLPLALGQLAAAEKTGDQGIRGSGDLTAAQGAAEPAPAQAAAVSAPPPAAPDSSPPAEPAATETGSSDPRTAGSPVSPRLELRDRLLAAAPELGRAALSYRRNVATVRRAAQPRRSPGPWRADREVLEEARRAVEFVHKLYDTYAEAWADQALPADLYEGMAAEADRFLAWTQLDRYVELAVLASTNAPRPPKPGQQVISAPREAMPVTEASPGAVVAAPAAPATPAASEPPATPETSVPPAEEKPAQPRPAESEPGRA
jgi:hypothetical protein